MGRSLGHLEGLGPLNERARAPSPTRTAPRRRGVALAAGFLCLATTCDSALRFEVSGDLGSEVVVRVIDASHESGQVQADLIVVGELHGDELWRLAGKATVRDLVYGTPVDGMTVTVGPKRLERGKRYYIAVRGRGRWRGGQYGTASFAIDGHGHVGPAHLDLRELGNPDE